MKDMCEQLRYIGSAQADWAAGYGYAGLCYQAALDTQSSMAVGTSLVPRLTAAAATQKGCSVF